MLSFEVRVYVAKVQAQQTIVKGLDIIHTKRRNFIHIIVKRWYRLVYNNLYEIYQQHLLCNICFVKL